MSSFRVMRVVKSGDSIRENQCFDTDLNKTSETTGNLSRISIKRSSLETTDSKDSGHGLTSLDKFPSMKNIGIIQNPNQTFCFQALCCLYAACNK